MEINKFKDSKIIVAHDRDDLVRIYFNPKNFRENNNKLVFDCDYYITIMPEWVENRAKIDDTPHPDTGKITDTIIHPEDWFTYSEWVKTDKPRSVIKRVF